VKFHQINQIRYLSFDNLSTLQVNHAIFARHGGVSPWPWESLNLGGTVGDDPDLVLENRKRAFRAIDQNYDSVFDVWQIHSDKVVCTNVPRLKNEPHKKADAILTDHVGITLFMRFADCVPLLLYDPVKRVIGLVHAGWQGTVKKIAESAVLMMKEKYGSRPGDVVAAIGPSIGPDHYQIGFDVADQVKRTFKEDSSNLLININGAIHMNLWKANWLLLDRCGVKNIELASICTACNVGDWYSHRGEHGKTGRFGVLIGM
jgi:YfiH family protein